MVIKLNESDSPVFRRTAKQRSVSLSACESEYMALSALAQEVFFLKNVFESVNYKTTLPIFFSDNQGAICVAHETASRLRAKHTDIKVHFVRGQICSGKMTLKYLPTTVMIADVLKKRASKCSFGADMQATLWKCLLRGSVEILVCDWSIFRHGCLEPKDSKRNCNCYIRECSETILAYDF